MAIIGHNVTYQMKVFRFYPWMEIWKFQKNKGKQLTFMLGVSILVASISYQVWGIVYHVLRFPEPPSR